MCLLLGLGCAGQTGSGAEAPAAAAQEPPSVPAGYVELEVAGVMTLPGGHAVLLVDVEGETVVPILIGDTEALAIQLRAHNKRFKRPLTHDLLDEVISRLGGELVKVHIDDLRGSTFTGTVFLRVEGELVKLDARPSDAIALAIGNHVPIYAARAVVERAGIRREDLERGPVPAEDRAGSI